MPADPSPTSSPSGPRWLICLAYAYLFLCFRGLLPLLLSEGSYETLEANAGWKAGVAAIQALCALAIAMHWRAVFRCLCLRSLPLFALILLPLISSLWSDSPLQSIVGGLGVAITGFFLLVLIEKLGHLQLMRICFNLSVAMAMASFAFVLTAPGLGLMAGDDAGSWRGCFMHKNSLGNRMLIGFMAAAALAVMAPTRRERLATLACAAVFALLIILSQSRTSLLGLAVTAGLLVMCNPGRLIPLRSSMRAALLTLLAVPALLVLLANTDSLLGFVADNQTLTGRTDLWNDIFAVIERRPMLGYGYQGFWSNESLRYQAFGSSGWQTGKAHNAVLDHILDVGAVGLLLFGLLTAVVLARWLPAARAYALQPTSAASGAFLFSTVFLVAMVPLGFSEVRIILHNDIHFALLVSTTAFFLVSLRPGPDRRVSGRPL